MKTVTRNSLSRLLAFLEQLEATKIWYRLEHVRDSVMVIVAIPGERWEVEFFDDDHVEVERFISSGVVEDEKALDRLLNEYADPEDS